MAFVEKTLISGYEFVLPNEEIKVSTEIPLRGWKTLSSLAISKTGNTADRDLEVHYRYSKNAIVYNDWIQIDLVVPVDILIKEDFLVEFKIARIGDDITGSVTLDTVVLQGDDDPSYWLVWDFIKDTIFKDIEYDDYNWNKLWINLLRKLYKRGIIPEYIERGELTENEDPLIEEDYIVYWKIVAYFYALLSELSRRKVDGLREDLQYLIEYLEQKGLFLCASCSDCAGDNIYIMENIFDEFRQRGTVQIAARKSVTKYANGEMLRLICFDPKDEFLFEYLPRHLSGWTMNRTSPIFRGKAGHIQLNKAPDDISDILDLTKYTIEGDVTLAIDDTKKIAQIDSDGSIAFNIVAEPYLSYELTFWTKFSAANVDMLSVEMEGFVDITPINLQKVSGGVETKILDNVSMPNGEVYYYVRCIIYSKGTLINGADVFTNLLQGENLKFSSVTTNRLGVKISCGGAGNNLKVWDIKFTPATFEVSSVYINSYNVMNAYLTNRNASVSIIDFEEKMRRYLIPYGTVFQMFYSPNSQFSPQIFLGHNDNSLLLQNTGGRFLI